MSKFVSKNSNLMVVLKPGIPGNILTGAQPQSGVYVRFQGGVVDVSEEKIALMLREHPKFGSDFIEVNQDEFKDPYENTRTEIEPAHVIMDMKYGQVEKVSGTPRKVKLPAEIQKAIKGEAAKLAKEMAKAMLPDMLKEAMKEMAAEAAKSSAKPEENEEKA